MALALPDSLSVVIMALNEEATIERQVWDTLSLGEDLGMDVEVVAVDDGSWDRTPQILDDIARRDKRVRVVHHPTNLGMGMAIRSGYSACAKEFVTQLPGDAQVRPSTLVPLLSLAPSHDLVLSTYARRDDGLLRRFVSLSFQATTWIVLGRWCAFTGTMVFRRSWLERVELVCRTFLVNLELPLKLMCLGVEPAFVTIEAEARARGRSKVLSPRGVATVLREMFSLRSELMLFCERGGGKQRK